MVVEENNWEMRNITDMHRVNETVETYESLGFEVKVEDFDPEKYTMQCDECMRENPGQFKVIFTKAGTRVDEELFDE